MAGRTALLGTAFAGVVAATALAVDTLTGEVDGIQYWEDSATTTAPNPAVATVLCPDGTEVSGGGFGQGIISGIPNDLGPIDDDADGDADDGYQLTMTFDAGTQTGTAQAICAPWNSQYHTASSMVKPGESKSVSRLCTGRTGVTGGGANLSGSASEAHVNSSYPIDGSDKGSKPDDGWQVRAYNATGANKPLSMVAICTRKTVSYRSANLTINPSTSTATTAKCPASKHLVGAGARFRGPASSGVLHALRMRDLSDDVDAAPDDDLLANGENQPGATAPKKLTAYAVCR